MKLEDLAAHIKSTGEKPDTQDVCALPKRVRPSSKACDDGGHDSCVQRWCECQCHDADVEDLSRPVVRFHLG